MTLCISLLNQLDVGYPYIFHCNLYTDPQTNTWEASTSRGQLSNFFGESMFTRPGTASIFESRALNPAKPVGTNSSCLWLLAACDGSLPCEPAISRMLAGLDARPASRGTTFPWPLLVARHKFIVSQDQSHLIVLPTKKEPECA